MKFAYQVPGVYKEDVLLRTGPQLPTGVPGFVGFARPRDGATAFDRPVELHRKGEFDTRFEAHPGGFLADAVHGFFQNGGVHCYVACAEPPGAGAQEGAEARSAALRRALGAFDTLDALDLVAVPDAMILTMSDGQQLDTAAVVALQKDVLRHCEAHGDRLAILDSLPGADEGAVLGQRRDLASGLREPLNGALYYPWLRIGGDASAFETGAQARAASGRLVPPCGHVAGIYARSDGRAGVYKAPANEEVSGVLDLERAVDAPLQGKLNPEGVNCLRAFPGRGVRVWGARTLSREAEWRYVNVRRLFLTLNRWVAANLVWADFESNTPGLWVRIERELSGYLGHLWTAGALSGATVEQAFYVKCDSETNPPEVREGGQVVTEIGLAPLAPAEFIVVRIVHRLGVEPR